MAIILTSTKVWAEYRVFELVLTKKTSEGPVERVMVSNLDPEQFSSFYPIDPGETISYRRTWMCRGRTNPMDPYCLKDQNIQATQESSN